jgi:2-polyprenyl-3-methyl-5-hydroxy-6-metoxy-1,4-benzoquinol methylase
MPIQDTATDTDLAALRDELISANTLALRLLERMEDRQARQALAEVLEIEKARAAAIAPLERWDGIPERQYEVQSGQHHRVQRVLDYVIPGDRVVDIGPSYGYMTGCLLREVELDHYCGIDISERALASIRSMAAVNGLTSRVSQLELRSIFDVDTAFLQTHRPDLVMVMEVLEHLQDPEGAIAAVAGAMSEDTALMFSVPLLGRLEHVWGHLSVFDSARLTAMCEGAGLHVQHIEPVHNVWTVVLASRRAAPPERLVRLAARGNRLPRPRTAAPRNVFKRLKLEPGKVTEDRSPAVKLLAPDSGGVGCLVTGDGQPHGLTVPLRDPYRLRLELSFPADEGIRAVHVEGLDASGTTTLRWTWNVTAKGPALPHKPTTFVLAPRRTYRSFRPGIEDRGKDTTALRIAIVVDRGQSGSVILHKAAALAG